MKKEKSSYIVNLAILTLITSILWIFFSLYRVFTEKSDVKVSEEILKPITPTLNEKIISEIENRVFIDQNQIPDIYVQKETDNVTNELPIGQIEENQEINQQATESAENITE